MHITDPIADMLTRIRNANNAKHDTVDVPASNMKKAIAQILLDEGYIKNFQLIDDGTQGVIRITSSTMPARRRSSAACAGCPSPVCASMPVPMSCPASCAAWVLPSCPRPRAS